MFFIFRIQFWKLWPGRNSNSRNINTSSFAELCNLGLKLTEGLENIFNPSLLHHNFIITHFPTSGLLLWPVLQPNSGTLFFFFSGDTLIICVLRIVHSVLRHPDFVTIQMDHCFVANLIYLHCKEKTEKGLLSTLDHFYWKRTT